MIKKLATLGILVLLFETAIRLLSNSQDFNSPNVIGGGFVLITAIILCIIFSLDYRYKEHVDNIIKQQGSAIKSLSIALKQKNKTSNAAEKMARNAFDTIGKEERGYKSYSPERETKTITEDLEDS